MLEIAGSGRFLLWLAKNNPQSRNFLGLEIRPKVCNKFLGGIVSVNFAMYFDIFFFLKCQTEELISILAMCFVPYHAVGNTCGVLG